MRLLILFRVLVILITASATLLFFSWAMLSAILGLDTTLTLLLGAATVISGALALGLVIYTRRQEIELYRAEAILLYPLGILLGLGVFWYNGQISFEYANISTDNPLPIHWLSYVYGLLIAGYCAVRLFEVPHLDTPEKDQ